MATNLQNIQAELQALANELDNDLAKYNCLELIDQYIAARTTMANATANDIQSYSIGGRSVTRINGVNYTDLVARLWNEINEILYGNVTYADFRTATLEQV